MGGEIRYSEAAPVEVFTELPPERHKIWAWNSDGSQLAFWDPRDPAGDLMLYAKNSDRAEVALPGTAYWLVNDRVPVWFSEPSAPPIRWAADGKHLLLYAVDNQDICLDRIDSSTGELLPDFPCWQVLDTTTGQLVWGVRKLFTNSGDVVSLHEEQYSPRTITAIDIAPDGRQLFLSYHILGKRFSFLYDLIEDAIVYTTDWSYYMVRWEY